MKKSQYIKQRNLERVMCKNLIWHIIIITIIMFIALCNIPKVSESYNDKTTALYMSNLATFEPQTKEESSKVEVDYYHEFTYNKDWPVFEEFEATAYCACPKCCGKWADGITASGTKATAKRTIAVDSNLIPLGSKVEIEGLGTYIAEDTGSAIKGKIIDIYFDTHEEALNFGRQKVNIRIISSSNGGN